MECLTPSPRVRRSRIATADAWNRNSNGFEIVLTACVDRGDAPAADLNPWPAHLSLLPCLLLRQQTPSDPAPLQPPTGYVAVGRETKVEALISGACCDF